MTSQALICLESQKVFTCQSNYPKLFGRVRPRPVFIGMPHFRGKRPRKGTGHEEMIKRVDQDSVPPLTGKNTMD